MKSLGKTERRFGYNASDENEGGQEMISDWDLLFWGKVHYQGKRNKTNVKFLSDF